MLELSQLAQMIYQKLVVEDSDYLASHKPYALAVSGGVDSMALLRCFEILQATCGLNFFVIHINHRLRLESEAEQEMMVAYCQERDLDLKVSIWQHQDDLGGNIEAKARAFRYHAFGKILKDQASLRLVTAHHSDDQVETGLMRLVHGGHLASFRGMEVLSPLYTYPKAKILRPLLDVEKASLYDLARGEGIPYQEDLTNWDKHFQRNRFRQDIIPYLERESVNFKAHFRHFQTDLKALLGLAQPQLNQLLTNLFDQEAGCFRIDLEALGQYSQAEQVLLMEMLFQRCEIPELLAFTRTGMEELVDFLNQGAAQGQWALPGHYVLDKVYQAAFIRLKTRPASYYQTRPELSERPLELDKAAIQLEDLSLSWTLAGQEKLQDTSQSFYLPQSLSDQALTIRHRQAGDYLKLPSGSQQKIRRFFINEKIAQADRQAAWLIVRGQSWVLGILSQKGQWLYRYPLNGEAAFSQIQRI
ncbi:MULTISPECIES: tRNA lysidine(34) synthetase TilS [Aerococcus]|uniref:tRNA(Ile)-lysidine synthase n=1 Tax=Aerococcus tenax TaxID=3078812 RepID=A0A5N1BLN9_9LACT|nr:tRNA lysidine(34) synthetase TilS [Aerococcus urinae]KAA9240280.1 tRNA lysidine(34) synthetase TilS [Aerococcus urinae]MDK6597837.1 tRNA lysidine(34) synthetase TilS [Aerococcus urinae]MDK7303332.1 tRNA lysidine(34) synthetase TilS [Aerococcus urinae]MDK7802501.1 tRNA lysidine(34) synthetase TilS [Aerococcus urinae]MDK8656121.1 tRNA lysidine(34) synthetase TilS [Aerococcus urinae]